MPAALAREAMRLPTVPAASMLPPGVPRRSASTDEAAASVAAGVVVDQLGGDVLVGAEHGQAGRAGRAVHPAAHPGVPAAAQLQLVISSGHYFAAFPALRTTRSPA